MHKNKIYLCIFILLIYTFNVCGAQPEPEHFVCVHGAWHGAWCWYEVAALLEEEGHTVTVIELPGHGIDFTDPLYITLDDYTDKITGFLDSLDHQVVLISHSMGGIPCSGAAEARPDKIKMLIYVSAFLLEDGQSLLDIALQDTGSAVLPNLIPLPASGLIDINRENIVDMFYHLSPANTIKLAESMLRANPIAPFSDPVTLTQENYGSVERFYIFTSQDHAITYPIQQLMVNNTPCEAVFTLDTDHSSFFSDTKNLMKIIDDILTGKY